MQWVQMCWVVWALYPFYNGQNNPTNIWLLSSMERTQSLSFHGQMTLRGCSHLVLPSVLSNFITSGQLQAWQFTPSVERVSTCVSIDLLSSVFSPLSSICKYTHLHYWNKWTRFSTLRKKLSGCARIFAELTTKAQTVKNVLLTAFHEVHTVNLNPQNWACFLGSLGTFSRDDEEEQYVYYQFDVNGEIR